MAVYSGVKIWIGSFLGALALIVIVVVIAQVTIERKQERQRKERLAQAYRDSLYREEQRQRELRESVWRLVDFVASADRKTGAESFAVYSPTVRVKGLNKVSLAIKWTPALRYEAVVLHFLYQPETYSAKYDLNDLTQRTIDLPMTWIAPDTSYTHTVLLRFFPKEGPALGFVADSQWESVQVIRRLRPPYETLRLDFSEWYIGNVHAEIDLAGAEYEIERMREKVRYRYR